MVHIHLGVVLPGEDLEIGLAARVDGHPAQQGMARTGVLGHLLMQLLEECGRVHGPGVRGAA